MGIYLSKNIKQKQTFTLTPSLKKSIDLLQLSRFELIKKIEKEVDENPFLEIEKDFNEIQGSYNQDFIFEIESKKTLREGLLEQVNDFNLNDNQIKLTKIIIECIDENGMLIEDIFEIEKISISLERMVLICIWYLLLFCNYSTIYNQKNQIFSLLITLIIMHCLHIKLSFK